MRINKWLAQATGLSRRAADQAIQAERVTINQRRADVGDGVAPADRITLDGKTVTPAEKLTLIFNKPVGYVCSRQGQGSRTIYDLLPAKYHELKPVGRLDKDSSGLLLLTNDGELANRLIHPRYAKTKLYEVTLNKQLSAKDQERITAGVQLDDGPSRLQLTPLDQAGKHWQIAMTEGRNRQIRRTFAALGYTVTALHRTDFGPYSLGDLANGAWRIIDEPMLQ